MTDRTSAAPGRGGGPSWRVPALLAAALLTLPAPTASAAEGRPPRLVNPDRTPDAG